MPQALKAQEKREAKKAAEALLEQGLEAAGDASAAAAAAAAAPARSSLVKVAEVCNVVMRGCNMARLPACPCAVSRFRTRIATWC